jgi:RNA-directed DNA polymerase
MKGAASAFNFSPRNLSQCHDVWSLAMLLGTDYENLASFLYSKKKKYRFFSIEKKSGDSRYIYAPVKRLKSLQYKVKTELENFYKPKKSTHGFVSGRSIITNAQNHTKKNYVLNIDLNDFFPTITFGRIKKLFESHPFNLGHSVATVLSHICCHNGKLPQGAPTSPLISNMIAYKLDRELSTLARSNNCTYSRYADDITFSFTHTRNHLPSNIVSTNKTKEINLGKKLCDIIEENGFSINIRKTRLQHKTQHQGVTGLTVNEKVNISRQFLRKTSSMINALKVYGSEKAEEEHFKKYHTGYIPIRQFERRTKLPGDLFIKKIKGRINYIRMIRGTSCRAYRKLMFQFTEALGNPNEEYAKNWLDVIADSTFVIDTYVNEHTYQGSGFLLKDVGIITNQHVIGPITKDNIHNVEIYNWEHRDKPLKLIEFVKSDEELDLAIIDPTVHVNSLRSLEWNESPDYSQGKTVFVIAFPNHKEGEPPTILETKIKGPTTFMKQKRIKVDKNIQHGSSGGVVVDTDGKVIGIASNGSGIFAKLTWDSSFIPIETLLTYINRS